eukprot:TRINITY_DN15897_c0_g2_i1.p1 TRINITY_DN15897_c0_g2~~TRINITY_DN15897_c0_g2_i1.p1  ORF type:complete len:343 (+),score=85.69 TRINITY_DN15897_c0_g2_i1:49-1077(+)
MSQMMTVMPVALHGHTRAITMVRYNMEGDLLFTTAKDTLATVWDAQSGERLGTYDGHRGAIWGCDVNAASTLLATAGADRTSRIWDVESGRQLAEFGHETSSRGVAWAHGDRHLACITDASMGQTPAINIFHVPEAGRIAADGCPPRPHSVVPRARSAIRMCVWGPNNDSLYYCCADGAVVLWDVQSEKAVVEASLHNGEARRLSWDSDHTALISAGWDKTAKLLDARDVTTIQTYEHAYPVNDACIADSTAGHHVLLGGGVAAVDAAGGANNKFEVKMHHKVLGHELGAISGHFGPVNALAVAPNSMDFASGGEDGFVRMHHFAGPCKGLGYSQEFDSDES